MPENKLRSTARSPFSLSAQVLLLYSVCLADTQKHHLTKNSLGHGACLAPPPTYTPHPCLATGQHPLPLSLQSAQCTPAAAHTRNHRISRLAALPSPPMPAPHSRRHAGSVLVTPLAAAASSHQTGQQRQQCQCSEADTRGCQQHLDLHAQRCTSSGC